MADYFRPSRRRLGGIMLGLACVFASGWIRSLTTTDALGFGEPNAYNVVVSTKAEIRWAKITPGLNRIGFEWSTSPPVEEESEFHWQESKIEWRQAFCGFDFGSGVSASLPNHHTQRWVIPYWSIVVPLTLISAGLLLSKRRQPAKIEPSQEPTA